MYVCMYVCAYVDRKRASKQGSTYLGPRHQRLSLSLVPSSLLFFFLLVRLFAFVDPRGMVGSVVGTDADGDRHPGAALRDGGYFFFCC